MKYKIITTLVCCLYLFMISPSAFAHKVNIFAYVEGDIVYTESYFPDGKRVKGGRIEVYDSNGVKLLEGVTDEKGLFNFNLPKKDNLKIAINASLGHKNSCILSIEKHTRAEKEKVPFVKAIVGIGFIFSIAGVSFYLLSRRNG